MNFEETLKNVDQEKKKKGTLQEKE